MTERSLGSTSQANSSRAEGNTNDSLQPDWDFMTAQVGLALLNDRMICHSKSSKESLQMLTAFSMTA